jgi:hypothetical protein
MRTLVWGAIIASGVSLGGCSGVDCRASCEASRGELRSVFGIQDPCTEPEWDEADTCEECDQLLLELYEVRGRSFCEEDDGE